MPGFQEIVGQQLRDREPIVLLVGKTAAHSMPSRIGYRDLLCVNHSAILCVSDFADGTLGKLDDMLTRTDDLHLDHRSARHAVKWRVAVDHLVEDAT